MEQTKLLRETVFQTTVLFLQFMSWTECMNQGVCLKASSAQTPQFLFKRTRQAVLSRPETLRFGKQYCWLEGRGEEWLRKFDLSGRRTRNSAQITSCNGARATIITGHKLELVTLSGFLNVFEIVVGRDFRDSIQLFFISGVKKIPKIYVWKQF